jgi:hypothetical protein
MAQSSVNPTGTPTPTPASGDPPANVEVTQTDTNADDSNVLNLSAPDVPEEIALNLLEAIAAAPDKKSATAILKEFLATHSSSTVDLVKRRVADSLKMLLSVQSEWDKELASALKDHPHLADKKDLLDLVMKTEVKEGDERPVKDAVAAVIKRASEMLGSAPKPSLPKPGSTGENNGAEVKKEETLTERRRREIREARGYKN